MSVLTFSVECNETRPGQAVFIVGSVPELGQWHVQKGLRCTTTAQTFPLWTSPEVVMNTGEAIELKIVVADEVNAANPVWESGCNKIMTLPAGVHQVKANTSFRSKEILLEAVKLPNLLENSSQAMVIEYKQIHGEGTPSPSLQQSARDEPLGEELVGLPSEMDAIFGVEIGRKRKNRIQILQEQACVHIQRRWKKFVEEQQDLYNALVDDFMVERLAAACKVQQLWKEWLQLPQRSPEEVKAAKKAAQMAAQRAARGAKCPSGLEAPPVFAGKQG